MTTLSALVLVGARAVLAGGSGTAQPAATAQPVAAAPAVDPGRVHDGRSGRTTVVVPRLEGVVQVDGVLDEVAWAEAAILTGFSQYFPNDGVAAADSTEVRVWYSPTALHVGVRAFASPGSVRATLADRDRITQDDNVQFFLGTYGDSRQALVFGVNPFGIQADGVLTETGAASGGGFASSTPRSRENADLAPDYVWRSTGRLRADGYDIEIAIPFKSLRYRAGDEQQWQLHVVRTVQATGHEQSWAPASRAAASFLAQSGMLTGLRDLERGLTVDVIPTVIANAFGRPVPGGSGWRYDRQRPEIGGSARWGITSNLTLAGTANPDFSQVEADATQFAYDPRVAIFFPERRPFFLESQEQFTTPNRLIYTRRIVQPVAAAKLTGKHGGFDIGVLSAFDSRETSADGRTAPLFNILRLQRDVGTNSRLGLVYTDKVDGARANRVLGLDGRFVRGIFSAQGQVAGSMTDTPDRSERAPLWDASAMITGRRFYARYAFNGISPDFDAQAGFIARPGIANLTATHRYTRFGAPGALVEAFVPEVYMLGRWQYADIVRRRPAQDVQLHLRTNTRFRGGWQLGGQVLIEEFGYDPSLYANYRLLRPRAGGGIDTTRYAGTPRLPNLDWVMSVSTPEFRRFSFNAVTIIGRDENFPEWTSARIGSLQGTLNLRPTEQLRLGLTFNQDEFLRWSDGSRVQLRNTKRLRAEYQATRTTFLRVIAEHTVLEQDDLRDDTRTGLPVYLARADGTLSLATAFQRQTARIDVLFSWLPTPGTVLFLGYGDLLRADQPVGPERLRRTSDVFFTKLSWLFRMQ